MNCRQERLQWCVRWVVEIRWRWQSCWNVEPHSTFKTRRVCCGLHPLLIFFNLPVYFIFFDLFTGQNVGSDVGGKVDGVEERKLWGMYFYVSGSRKRYQWTRQGKNFSIQKCTFYSVLWFQNGDTALMYAIENPKSTLELLELGADTDVRNNVRHNHSTFQSNEWCNYFFLMV